VKIGAGVLAVGRRKYQINWPSQLMCIFAYSGGEGIIVSWWNFASG